MIKALLITAMFGLFSNTAMAHGICHTDTIWEPGYWQAYYRPGSHVAENRWIEGRWITRRVCPPPPPQRPVIRITVPPVFPHVGHRYRGYSHRHQSHPHRHHDHSRRHHSHSHRR